MHKTLDLVAELCLDRHDVPPAALRDDGLLQILLIGLRANQLVELLAHAQRRRANFAADARKRHARRVCDLFLAHDGHRDALLDKLVRLERLKAVIERRFDALALLPPVRNASDGAQRRGNRKQLRQIQHAARLCAAQRVRHIRHAVERRRAELRHQDKGVVRLLEQTRHVLRVGVRLDLHRELRRIRARRFICKLGEDLIQLQRFIIL